jgi:hypothetical protein
MDDAAAVFEQAVGSLQRRIEGGEQMGGGGSLQGDKHPRPGQAGKGKRAA